MNKNNKKENSRSSLKIYAFTTPRWKNHEWKRGDKMFGKGVLKIGQTWSDNVEKRIKEQEKGPIREFTIDLIHYVKLNKDNQPLYTDHKIHKILQRKGINRLEGEWFECSLEEIKQAIIECETGKTIQT